MNNTNEIYSNGLKGMAVAVEIYSVKQTWAIKITVRWCPQRLPSF